MCMIVDTSRMADLLAEPAKEDATPVRRWVDGGAGNLVYTTGDKFDQEMTDRALDWLSEREKAGRAKLILPASVQSEVRRLESLNRLRSDDAHVLALARVSGARLLYTRDKALMDDFRDPEIVPRPRGKIYSGAKNARLLTANACRRS